MGYPEEIPLAEDNQGLSLAYSSNSAAIMFKYVYFSFAGYFVIKVFLAYPCAILHYLGAFPPM